MFKFFKMVYLVLMAQFRSIIIGGTNASVCGLCQYETPETYIQCILAFQKSSLVIFDHLVSI